MSFNFQTMRIERCTNLVFHDAVGPISILTSLRVAPPTPRKPNIRMLENAEKAVTRTKLRAQSKSTCSPSLSPEVPVRSRDSLQQVHPSGIGEHTQHAIESGRKELVPSRNTRMSRKAGADRLGVCLPVNIALLAPEAM